MTNDKDHYDVLGIEPTATSDQIKEAYLYKVNILHPDRLAAMTEKIRRMAEKDLIRVNVAYEVLSDPRRRKEYDSKRFGAAISKGESISKTDIKDKPKPEVYPKVIRFEKALPYVKQKASFFIRNIGGPFSKLLLSETPDWLKITSTQSLQIGSKLPIKVDIEGTGIKWGKVYSSRISIRLDDCEETVYVELHMQKEPRKGLFKR